MALKYVCVPMVTMVNTVKKVNLDEYNIVSYHSNRTQHGATHHVRTGASV